MLSTAALAPSDAPINQLNPTARLAAATLVSFTALAAADWLTPVVLLAVVAATLPFTGVRLRRLAHRLRLLWLAALTVAVVNTVFAADKSGPVLAQLGPLLITESNAAVGIALGLRVAAVALVSVLAFATVDPTDLADSLTQQLKAPPKFAVAALAAFRMLPLLSSEWRMITLARRARGVEAGRNPVKRARLFASVMFGLLVGAIRRAGRLATAMDARGFDSGVARGTARPQRMGRADWLLLAGTAVVCAAAVSASVAAGVFRLVF